MRVRFFIIPTPCLALLAAIVMLGPGCANMPDPADREAVLEYMQVKDPIEPLNRQIFAVNQGLDNTIFKPAAEVYRAAVPETARQGVHNFMRNLRTPLVLLNDLLQGDIDRAVITFSRFMVNSTAGILGLADVAAELGVVGHNEDFGQTLAIWGVPSGPYLMLPVLGPSSPRDTVGLVMDVLTSPLNAWATNSGHSELVWSRVGVEALDQRTMNIDILDDVEKSSLDFYAAIRSLYRQRRAYEISNEKESVLSQGLGVVTYPDIPDYDDANRSRR